MKLAPHVHRAKRHEKLRKHWFAPAERWWAVQGDLVAWNEDWHAARGAGLFGGGDVEPGSPAEARLADVYARYLGVAERACDDAIARGTVFPQGDRASYVGRPGILVVVAQRATADGAPIVTAYRVVPPRAKTDEEFDRAALAKAERRSVDRHGVRMATRRSSLRARIEE